MRADHPLWIVYTSGTSGPPKAIVHSHLGALLGTMKDLTFHVRVFDQSVLFFYSTTSWTTWNLVLGGLSLGTSFVLYDGSPFHPDIDRLWAIEEQSEKILTNLSKCYILTADTIPELAASMQIDPVVLEQAIDRYNANVRSGPDPDFGRTSNLIPVDTPPYCIADSANALTSTYGGITTNRDMAVVDWMGEAIHGLFAAGEFVGGFHGACYYSGTSLSSSSTFGMLAGQAAATFPPI